MYDLEVNFVSIWIINIKCIYFSLLYVLLIVFISISCPYFDVHLILIVVQTSVSHFLGQCPAIAQIRGQYFRDYYLSVNDIFDNQHISTIVNFANHTKRLVVPEELDQTGVT